MSTNSISGQLTKIPQAIQCGQGKKKKKNLWGRVNPTRKGKYIRKS